MKLTMVELAVADQVWIATALLHHDNPKRNYFSNQEILHSCRNVDREGALRRGISQHISTHCVASEPARPAKHRMLTRMGHGRRRLFRPGDPEHPDRREGRVSPAREELPEKYRHLVEWYENEYARASKEERPAPKSRGASAETLMKLMGRISREDADEIIRIIDDSCGRVDVNEW